MKIVQVTHECHPFGLGGISVYTHSVARALSEKHEVDVFLRHADRNRPEYEVETGSQGRVSLTSINHNFSLKPDFQMEYRNKDVDGAFRRFLKEKRPDVVHFQFLGAGLSTGMVAVAEECGIPTVLTLHDYWFMCPRGQMMDHRWNLCQTVVEPVCAKCVYGAHAPVSALVRGADGQARTEVVDLTSEAALRQATTRSEDRAFVGSGEFTVDGVTKTVLMEHPPSEVQYRVRVPRNGRLRFSLAMHPSTWEHEAGEGVLFTVAVARGDRPLQELFSRYIDPKHQRADRKWHGYSVDLAEFSRQTVELIFTTRPGPMGDTSFCTAGWGELRIEAEGDGIERYGLVGIGGYRGLLRRLANRGHESHMAVRKRARMFLTLVRHRAQGSPGGKRRALRTVRERNRYLLGMLQKVDVLISPSQFLRQKYIEFGVPAEKIVHSRYGIDLSASRDERSRRGVLVFGYMGTLMPTKGVHVLVDAFGEVPKEAAELRVYGGPPNQFHEGYAELMERKAQDKENIHMMGEYDIDDTGSILEQLDVLVVPSIWHENSPLTIQEAFIAHVPVITSNIGGMAELVTDKVSGLLFRVRDELDLRSKIMMLVAQPNLVTEMSRNTPPIKSVNDQVAELEQIYEGLVMPGRTHLPDTTGR